MTMTSDTVRGVLDAPDGTLLVMRDGELTMTDDDSGAVLLADRADRSSIGCAATVVGIVATRRGQGADDGARRGGLSRSTPLPGSRVSPSIRGCREMG